VILYCCVYCRVSNAKQLKNAPLLAAGAFVAREVFRKCGKHSVSLHKKRAAEGMSRPARQPVNAVHLTQFKGRTPLIASRLEIERPAVE